MGDQLPGKHFEVLVAAQADYIGNLIIQQFTKFKVNHVCHNSKLLWPFE
jgi:hypothetical protein